MDKLRKVKYADLVLLQKEKQIEKTWKKEALDNNKAIFHSYQERKLFNQKEVRDKKKLYVTVLKELQKLRREMLMEGFTLWKDLPWITKTK